ncbi:phosphonoacetaldehyde dehydrogenase [Xanthomonas hortorum]|nr:phosphonoacetaldehyde dehydrogenase [Xanthomonas hortorum]
MQMLTAPMHRCIDREGADMGKMQLRHEQWRIAGARVDGATDRLEVRFPYDRALVGTVPLAQAEDVRSALAQAYAYRATLTRHQRHTILLTARDLLIARTAAFVQSIVAESGLCVRDASYEVGRAAEVLRTAAHQVLIDDGDIYACDITQSGQQRRVYTQRDPLLGVIVAITPFNHPLNQVAHKIAPSIATNNRMILKPSEKTPLTALLFADLLTDAGLPGPMLTVITGKPEVIGDALLTSEQVDLVTFTGSVAAGKQIAARCVYKRQVLELGGNDPMIVMEDADLDEAVSLAVAGAYRNSGQRCTAIKRLLVHRQVADAFVERLVQATQGLKVGDPFDPQTDLGTVIDDAAAAQIERRVDAAAAAGAQVLCGHRRNGAQYLPTVVDHVMPTMELVQQETFGPVAPIIRIDSIDDAIRIANASDFGLSSALCSNRWDYIQRCVAELQTGSVNIREVPGFRLESTPFGGIKSSGLGYKEGVLEAMSAYTNVKTYSLPWGERTVA